MNFITKLFTKNKEEKPKIESKNQSSQIFPFLKQLIPGEDLMGKTFKLSDFKAEVQIAKIESEGKVIEFPILQRTALPDSILWYGFDRETTFLSVNPTHYNDEINTDTIDSIAFKNLSKRIVDKKQLKINSLDGGLYMITCGGVYESVVIFLPDIIKQFQELVKGDIFIAILARDLVLFSSAENSQSWVEKKSILKKQYETLPKSLSKYLYRVSNDEWTVVANLID